MKHKPEVDDAAGGGGGGGDGDDGIGGSAVESGCSGEGEVPNCVTAGEVAWPLSSVPPLRLPSAAFGSFCCE